MGFKRHASYLMLLRVAILVSGAITSVVIARALGPEGKGKLELAVVVFPMFIASLGSMGTRMAGVYFSSFQGGSRNIAKIVLITSLTLGIVYALALLFFRDTTFVQTRLLRGLPQSLIILSACLIPIHIVRNSLDGVLQGRFRFGTHTLIQLTGLAIKLFGVVVLIAFLGYKLGGAIAIYSLAALTLGVLTLLFVFRQKQAGDPTRVKHFFAYALRAWWGGAALRANMQLDSLVVNAMLDNASLGIYAIATLLSRPLLQIPGALSQALLPRVAASTPENASSDCALLNRNWIWLGALIGVAVCALAGILIAPVFGSAFTPAAPALWAMMPGVVAFGMSSILAQFLAGTGRPQLSSTASVVALLANVPALYFFVPRYGMVGAGLAISVAHGARALTMAYFFRKTSGLRLLDFLLPRRSDLNYYKRGAKFLRGKLLRRK